MKLHNHLSAYLLQICAFALFASGQSTPTFLIYRIFPIQGSAVTTENPLNVSWVLGNDTQAQAYINVCFNIFRNASAQENNCALYSRFTCMLLGFAYLVHHTEFMSDVSFVLIYS
jgi:hypothetical protein